MTITRFIFIFLFVASFNNRLTADNQPINQNTGIAFEEVSIAARIDRADRSHGVAVGDFNDDGLPDIWDDFHLDRPSLFVNQGDGTFEDEIRVLNPNKDLDEHGAAWADYDHDGDQDLVVTGGGGGDGAFDGSPNLLFVNQGDGTYTEVGVAAGIDYQIGRGRTPHWLDFNGDSLLDVIFFNETRSDDQAPTTLFQNNGPTFTDVGQSTGFVVPEDADFGLLTNLVNGQEQPLLFVDGTPFPQVVFQVGPDFQKITSTLGISPSISLVQDAVFADFDGDLDADLYATRSLENRSEAGMVNDHELRVSFHGNGTNEGITFQVTNTITVNVYGPKSGFVPTSTIFIGDSGYHPLSQFITLSASDPNVAGMPDYEPGVDAGVFIGFDPVNAVWSIYCSEPGKCNIQIIILTEDAATDLTTVGFNPEPPALIDAYWTQNEQGFDDTGPNVGFTEQTRCGNFVAADFDNDMDLDIYQVCTRIIWNLPNILYENQGDGTFVAMAGAGGAEGTTLGTASNVVTLDYDLDGFLDLYLNNGKGAPPFNGGPAQLYRNLGNSNHWLEIDLVGVTSNQDAIGAVVYVTAGGVTQVREQNGGMHASSQNHQRLHFGLGENLIADKIEVHWPSGLVQTEYLVPADRLVTLIEGQMLKGLGVPTLSMLSDGVVGSLSYKNEDIIAHDPYHDLWYQFFDGSDVGLNAANVDAFTLLANGEMLLSFLRPVDVPNVGTVQGADIVRFVPDSLGSVTSGTFYPYFVGAEHDLTTLSENIDAFTLDGDQLLISTVGQASYPDFNAGDEDLVAFDWNSMTWSMFFDGSDLDLRDGSEDIVGAGYDQLSGLVYFNTAGNYSIAGLSGDGNDIIACAPISLGKNTRCNLSLFWDGDVYQLAGALINALHMR